MERRRANTYTTMMNCPCRYIAAILLLVFSLLTETTESFSSSPKSISRNNKQTHLIFPGGGVFFNWQGGVISYLREQHYDLTNVTFTGSSAGALTATLAATGVDFNKATDTALRIASQHHVWERPAGLRGVLGNIMEEWLDELLPNEETCLAALQNDGRLSILLTPVPLLWEKQQKKSFESRENLIDACLASIYLPFFTDGGVVKFVNRRPFIDGNFLSTGKHYLRDKEERRNSKTIVLNWQKDRILKDKGEDDLVATLTPEAVWNLVDLGKQYAQELESKGKFNHIPKLQDADSVNPFVIPSWPMQSTFWAPPSVNGTFPVTA